MSFGPSDRYYDAPETVPCCAAFEDGETDEDHDPRDCLSEQAEAAAEAKAERDREDAMLERDDPYY